MNQGIMHFDKYSTEYKAYFISAYNSVFQGCKFSRILPPGRGEMDF